MRGKRLRCERAAPVNHYVGGKLLRQLGEEVEPRARVELATCRLRIGMFFHNLVVVNLSRLAAFVLFRANSGSDLATQFATISKLDMWIQTPRQLMTGKTRMKEFVAQESKRATHFRCEEIQETDKLN
jgi:hypothetical protein